MSYVPDNEWLERRDTLAATLMMRAAAELYAGRELTEPDIAEAARQAAGLKMAEIDLLPESVQEPEAA